MTSRFHRLAASALFLICLSVPAGAAEVGLSSAPVFELRGDRLVRSAAEPVRSGEFPTARPFHAFDRPSRAALRRLRERSERRLLRAGAAEIESWHVAVIRVSFRTNRARDLTSIRTEGDFDLTPGGTSIIDPTPHDKAYFDAHMQALARYYHFQSCGAALITWEVLPEGNDDSYRLSDIADYGPGRGGAWTTEMLVRFVRDAVRACDSTLALQGYPVRLSEFDAIVLAHAGANLQSDVLGNSPNDIPSFFARLGGGDEIAVEGGTHLVRELSVIPETAVQDGYNGGIAAVLAHEFGHQLGLPDLYDIYSNLSIVGYFDNMDGGGLLGVIIEDQQGRKHAVQGIMPGGLSAWSRYFLGWARADTVRTFENAMALPAVGKCPARLVRVEIAADEYFLLENRAANLEDSRLELVRDPRTGVIMGWVRFSNGAEGSSDQYDFVNGYDYLLPTESPEPGHDGGPGLLVWHVDEYFIARRWEANEVNSRWPFGVRLLEADGVFDLGDPTSRFRLGWFHDAFYAGNATEMSDSTLPPAWSNWRVPTGARLERVSGRDTLMTFGTGVRDLRATKMIGGGWRPARHGVLHLPGDYRALIIDESGSARLAGEQEPVFSLDSGAEDDPLLTPAAYAPGFEATTGAGAVLLARRSGAIYAFSDGDWQVCPGWPRYPPGLETHPVPLVTAAGTLVAAAGSNGALYLWRSDGIQVPRSPLVMYDDLRFTGNLVVRLEENQDEKPEATGIYFLSHSRSDPAGVWLTLCDITSGAPEPDGAAAVFVRASREEIAGPVFLVGGEVLPQRPGSEVWIVFGQSGRAVLCGRGEIISERDLGVAITEPPAVADIDGDGRLDLVCTDGRRIFVVGASGANVTGWPRGVNDVFALPTAVRVGAAPVAVSASGRAWIAAATDAGILFLFDGRGALVPGWPRKTASTFTPGVDFLASGDEGLLACVDQVFNARDDDFSALRPEGGRARWRVAPGGAFDPRHAWGGVYGGPGRAAFAAASAGGGDPDPLWTELASNLVIYPNPSSGRRVVFRFSAPEVGEALLQVFTLSGEIVLESSKRIAAGGQEEFEVSMAGRAPGVYLCRIVVSSAGRSVETRGKFAIVN